MVNTSPTTEDDSWMLANTTDWCRGMQPTITVARKDGKDISAKQVEVLCVYIKAVLVMAMQRVDKDFGKAEDPEDDVVQ